MILNDLLREMKKCEDETFVEMIKEIGEGDYKTFYLKDARYEYGNALVLFTSDTEKMTNTELLSKIDPKHKCRDILVNHNDVLQDIKFILGESIYFYY